MTDFTSPFFALTTTAMGCVKLHWYRARLQNADALLIRTVVRLCVVLVSEASTRAMVLAEESGISPALSLPRVIAVLLMPRHYSKLSGEDGRKAKRRKRLVATVVSACFPPPCSAWQDLKKAAVLAWT